MSKKLLLADDSITIQKVIGITFAHEDYELIIADNGDAALEMARESRPDLILADVYMPGKNGYELCSAIKNDAQLKRAPVLLLSGTFEPFDEKKAEASGADSWIAKPFESQALIDRVEELLLNAPQEIPEEFEPANEPAPREEEPHSRPEPAALEPIGEDTAAERSEFPEIEADMWDEFELSEDLTEDGADSEIADVFENVEEIEEEWPEDIDEEGDSELWGAVSFSEEDLGEESDDEEDLFEDDDFWESGQDPLSEGDEDFTLDEPEESFRGVGEAESASAGDGLTPEDLEVAANSNDEILPLDEVDILEEENLGTDEWEEEENSGDFEFTEEDGFAEDISASLRQVEVEPGGGEVFSFEEPDDGENAELVVPEDFEDDETMIPEPGKKLSTWDKDSEEIGGVAPEEMSGTGNAAFLSEAEGAFQSAEEFAPASEQVEDRVRSLDDEEVARIVEKVAGAVIEKMAKSVLEKIAWEVVPDLAESMIRDEIRKIKEEAR